MTEVHPNTCVDPETMAAFIDGRLDTPTSARVERHLGHCDECYERFGDVVAMARREDARAQGESAARGYWHRRWLAAAAALVIASGGLWWWRSPQRRITMAVAELAEAPRTMRFSTGQLSVDQGWAPAPSPLRGPNGAAEASLDVGAAVISIERASAGHVSAPALHALGLAHLASGNVALAVTNLTDAMSLAGNDAPTALRDDLAAALLERYRTDGNAADLTRALDSADRALRQTPNDAAALFNRALALDWLGAKDLGVQAWHTYLQREVRPAWLAEARERLQALTSKAPDTRAATTALFYRIEHQLLPAWLAAAQHGTAADTNALREATVALGRATPDREFAQLLSALQRDRVLDGDDGCAQKAVAGLLAWRHAYEMLDPAGRRAADQEGRGLACLGLRSVGAEIAGTLLEDRNAAYDHLTDLTETAERLGFLRSAALAWISLGNTALRRTDLTTGVGLLERAGSLALTAQDLELAATAEAMMGDAYQEEGNEPLAWLHLQRALTWLPMVQSPRLFYSIVRACADEARLEHHPAASLTFSALLLQPGTKWTYPGALAYARMERAEALQQVDDTVEADAELRIASAAMMAMPAGSIRDELSNELETSRGHLETAMAPAAALAPLTDAIRYFRRHDTTFRLVGVLTDRGRAEQAIGQPWPAEEDWADGAKLIEDQQPSIRDEQLRISRLSSLWDVYSELISARLSRPVAALQTAEAARSRELLDSLGRSQPLGRFDPLAGGALWSWLPADTTAIVFCVLPNALVRWTVQSSGVSEAQLPVSAARLDVLAHLAVAGLQQGQPTAASSLGQLLFDAVHLAQTTKQLLIVPDGALHYVPFAALSFGEDPRFLIQRFTLITAPSLSAARAFSAVRDRQSHQEILLAGYGDPEEGLPGLPGVATELNDVQQLYPSATVLAGASATPRAVMAAALHSAIVHIASHAVINAAFPSQSHLVLAPGSDGNGALRPADIAVADFQEHPLVFLSACATATGEVYRGEGVMSLARPFLAAGASAVIATMWPIGDADTAHITASIYHALQHHSPAQAVAESQRNAIANGVRIDQWASFVVFGRPDTTVLHLESGR